VLCEADQEPDRRLTVGYVSPDLFTHSVSYFAEAPLRHHSKAAVQLIVYNCVPKVLSDADKHVLFAACVQCLRQQLVISKAHEHVSA